mgnify:CR=1 FL=1
MVQASPRSSPTIIRGELLGSKDDGERVTFASLPTSHQGPHRGVVPKGLSRDKAVREATKTAPEGNTSVAGNMEVTIPLRAVGGGLDQSDHQPEPNKQSPLREGGANSHGNLR